MICDGIGRIGVSMFVSVCHVAVALLEFRSPYSLPSFGSTLQLRTLLKNCGWCGYQSSV